MSVGTFKRSVMDLLIGFVAGVIIRISMTAYFVILGIAIIMTIIIIAKAGIGTLSTYGNDEQGNFDGWIVLIRIITVNIGAFLGQFAMGFLT